MRQKPLPDSINGFTIVTDLGVIKRRRTVIAKCKYCHKNWKVGYIFLRTERTKSCGCMSIQFQKETMSNKINARKNGRTKLYAIWAAMKQRCYNPNDKSYKRYGGIGVTVCEEWKNSYLEFEKWCLNNGHKDGMVIDKDVKQRGIKNKIYSPSTCSIITKMENTQSRNQSRTPKHFKLIKGKYYGDKSVDGIRYTTPGFKTKDEVLNNLEEQISANQI